MLKIRLSVKAKSFNDKWPRIKISNNNLLLDDVECKGDMILTYNVYPDEWNVLSIELYNKSFGDNGIWDVDSSGQGMELCVTDVEFDDVSIGHLLHHTPFLTQWTKNQKKYETQEFMSGYTQFNSSGVMSFNGCILFEYRTPIYKFLIDKKYKVPYDSSIAFYSNSTELFHYERGMNIVKEIKNIIKNHG